MLGTLRVPPMALPNDVAIETTAAGPKNADQSEGDWMVSLSLARQTECARYGWHPAGMRMGFGWGRRSGGVAALSHRLMSAIPAG